MIEMRSTVIVMSSTLWKITHTLDLYDKHTLHHPSFIPPSIYPHIQIQNQHQHQHQSFIRILYPFIHHSFTLHRYILSISLHFCQSFYHLPSFHHIRIHINTLLFCLTAQIYFQRISFIWPSPNSMDSFPLPNFARKFKRVKKIKYKEKRNTFHPWE